MRDLMLGVNVCLPRHDKYTAVACLKLLKFFGVPLSQAKTPSGPERNRNNRCSRDEPRSAVAVWSDVMSQIDIVSIQKQIIELMIYLLCPFEIRL
jgi:hypothetical protein